MECSTFSYGWCCTRPERRSAHAWQPRGPSDADLDAALAANHIVI
jgi:hypothetical protein